MDRNEQAIALGIEQSCVGDRSGSDNAGDAALDGTLRRCRITDLLADRNRFAAADELRQILVDRVIRHARHRNRAAGGLAARSQRDVEERSRALRVAVEQLVEIAHAVEHELVGMLSLYPKVLLHHRGMGRQRRLGGQRGRVHRRHYKRRSCRSRRPTLSRIPIRRGGRSLVAIQPSGGAVQSHCRARQ